MKTGFIGLGNMAGAMIGGMLEKQIMKAEDIIGSAKTAATRDRVREKYHIMTAETNVQVAEEADILFLAVKPISLAEVIAEIRDAVKKDALVVSIAAGRDLKFLKEAFRRPDLKIIRCMPNTPALVLEGCTGICAGEEVPREEVDRVVRMMGSFGRASVVPERLMDVVVGVSGSSPAYVFLFIEAMADEAVAEGMPRKQAYEFAAQAVLGSAKMVLEMGMHPGELKDMVCSPGGTTIQAVKVLEEKGMRAAVMDAMEACIERSRGL
ncbi:MAG: pyrroline-5-carboxylate reductase [Lachnospiraceae bacterium]|nr:pyrroline-5-carboxylate reductase [Lachnospiraceae bacterium]MCM1239597.1 pyrroline-5-carboxylate reductase [Lachnospiraceae bacterium]MCM1302752.1 pyrroline-5-carboxylate reductase [Butyrivibrio sp.]MCM1342474.1 pyrroline-5-carboxylate reductase [Muribaculaceae bacterium]MCM1410222.1 pyrroline-5-carboxylate reductase [Lachnospiraceae bacterium]